MTRTSLKIGFLSLAVVVLIPTAKANAAGFPGKANPATQYQVTVKKVELCTSSNSTGACNGALSIGSGNKAFDIASVSAGAQAGSYANLNQLPIGQTFTHIRVTIDSAIIITGSGTDETNVSCSTKAAGGGGVHTASTGITPAAAASATLYVPAYGTYNGGPVLVQADFNPAGQSGIIDRPSDSDVTITYPLAGGSFTPVQNKVPTVTVKFDTQSAVGFLNGGPGACFTFPEPPVVTISIQ